MYHHLVHFCCHQSQLRDNQKFSQKPTQFINNIDEFSYYNIKSIKNSTLFETILLDDLIQCNISMLTLRSEKANQYPLLITYSFFCIKCIRVIPQSQYKRIKITKILIKLQQYKGRKTSKHLFTFDALITRNNIPNSLTIVYLLPSQT